MREQIFFVVFVLYYTKRRCSEIKPHLKVEIEDGHEDDTVLYQFLETEASNRTFIGLDQLLKCLGFSLYPLSFFEKVSKKNHGNETTTFVLFSTICPWTI